MEQATFYNTLTRNMTLKKNNSFTSTSQQKVKNALN